MIVYPIEVKFKNKSIVNLWSRDLSKNFINEYNARLTSSIQLNGVDSGTIIKKHGVEVNVDVLCGVIKDHIEYLHRANARIGMPRERENANKQKDNFLIEAEVDVKLNRGCFEVLGKTYAIGIFLFGMFLNEADFLLAARTVVEGGKNLAIAIPGLIGTTLMSLILFKYSGAIENMQSIGRNIDDKFRSEIKPRTEFKQLIDLDVEKQDCVTEDGHVDTLKHPNKSVSLANKIFVGFILSLPPILATTALAINSYQSLIGLGKLAEEKNDPLFTASVVKVQAIASTMLSILYGGLQNFSYAFKPYRYLTNKIDGCGFWCLRFKNKYQKFERIEGTTIAPKN